MDFAGRSAELEILQEREAIMFRSVPNKRWVDMVYPVAIAVGALAGKHLVYYILGSGMMIWWIFHWLQRKPDELWVTDTQLVSSKSGVIRWRNVPGLQYESGGEDDPSGLYVRGRNLCLLPHLNAEQAGQVIDTIYARFTNLESGEDDEGWSIFGKKDELLSLGLTGPRE